MEKMSKEQKVSLSREKAESLREQHGLTEEVIGEILEGIEVESKPLAAARTKEEAVDPEAAVFKSLSEGNIGMGEAMFLGDYYDRKDRRKREDQARKEFKQPPRTEGIPEWAKPMIAENKEILARMKSTEEEKKIAAAVKDATAPLKSQLEKKDDRTTRLEETVAKLSEPPKEKVDLGQVIGASVAVGVATALKDAGIGTAAPKSKLEEYINFRKLLQDAELLPDKNTGNLLGPGGTPMPVTGAVSATLAYSPFIAEQLVTTFVKGARELIGEASGAGLIGSPTKKEPTFKLPSKPRQDEDLGIPTISESVLVPEEVAPGEPEAPIITMPKKPTLETVEAPVEAPEVKEAPTPKVYSCKYCNLCSDASGPFDKPWKIAGHVKKCAKAIEAKKKGKADE